MLNESAEKAYKLLENLLTWSRMQRGLVDFNPMKLELIYVVSANVELFAARASEKNIVLTNHIKRGIYIYVDHKMIDTVIRNLINNALKFTTSGGKVDITAIETYESVEVSVSDTGIGIAAEHLKILFNVDSKIKTKGTGGEEGTGLGLPLCKEFVEKHGGKIWAESEIGKGSTFKFTLPKNGY